MKVYIVSRSVDYEGSIILRVLDAQGKALEVCRNGAVEWKKKWLEQEGSIEPLPTGFKVGDVAFTYEEWEVE